ncbi:MAG: hypothetical protein U0Q12_23755 [Vicinamibacterales bacterium]
MARIQTGTIAGFYLELVTAHVSQHSLVTSMDEATTQRIRDVLNRALADIVALAEKAPALTDAIAQGTRPGPPGELD